VRDPGDELPHFGAEMRATESGSRPPRPVKSLTLPMPAQDRLRLHQTQVLAPTLRPEAVKPDPQDSIRSPEARMRIGSQRDLELMAGRLSPRNPTRVERSPMTQSPTWGRS